MLVKSAKAVSVPFEYTSPIPPVGGIVFEIISQYISVGPVVPPPLISKDKRHYPIGHLLLKPCTNDLKTPTIDPPSKSISIPTSYYFAKAAHNNPALYAL